MKITIEIDESSIKQFYNTEDKEIIKDVVINILDRYLQPEYFIYYDDEQCTN